MGQGGALAAPAATPSATIGQSTIQLPFGGAKLCEGWQWPMNEKPALCPNCKRPLALPGAHGGSTHCAAASAECWDCVLDCRTAEVAMLRAWVRELEALVGSTRPPDDSGPGSPVWTPCSSPSAGLPARETSEP